MKKEKENNDDVPEFIKIHYSVYQDTQLNSIDKFLYGAICWYVETKKMRKCIASNATLASLIKTTPATISNSLVRLERGGFIRREFADKNKQKTRQEIIPLVGINNLPKNIVPFVPKLQSIDDSKGVELQSIDESFEQKNDVKNSEKLQSMDESKGVELQSIDERYLVKLQSIDEHVSSIDESYGSEPKVGIGGSIEPNNAQKGLVKLQSVDEERESIERIRERELIGSPLVTPNELFEKVKIKDQLNGLKIYSSPDEVPHQLAAEAIAFFLPIYPASFVTKDQFAIPANYSAVKKILVHTSLDELKDILEKYNAEKGNKFRPEATNLHNLCNYKWEAVKSFVSKSAGGLWAQRSISTPEQSRVRDEQYKGVMDRVREKKKKYKAEWEAEHQK